MRLDGLSAIVTGASSGIGRGIALAYAREGARLLLADIDTPGGVETCALAQELGAQAQFLRTDVSSATDAEEAVKACIREYGGVDILVNNAGVVRMAPFHETTEADWDFVLDINLKSIFLLCRHAIPAMLRQGKGKIINVSSIAGLAGFATVGPYCASKGGVDALTRALAMEYAEQRINVNCIAPGVIRTAMTKDMLGDEASAEGYDAGTPYPRFGEPADIAHAAVYLASSESDFVTGEILVVDGGWLAK